MRATASRAVSEPVTPKAPVGRGAAPTDVASRMLELQRTYGNRVLARRAVKPQTEWAKKATPEMHSRALEMDKLEKLTDEDLVKAREAAAAGATGLMKDKQDEALRRLEAIENVAATRGLAPPSPNFNFHSRQSPVVKRLNVRAHLEEGVRLTGSFEKALKGFGTTAGIEADIDHYKAEAATFRKDFQHQALVTAQRMLDGSIQGIRDIVESYGLPWSTTKYAAEEVARGRDLDGEVDAVIVAAQRSSDVDAKPAYKKRHDLAVSAEKIRRLQELVKQRDQEAVAARQGAPGQGSRASIPDEKAEARLWAARAELNATWAAAERLHPILTALRRGGDIETVDVSSVDKDSPVDEMKGVLRVLVPKLRDIFKARAMLISGPKSGLDPVSLPAVVALTRTNMFIPKGSLRHGIVNDMAADAARGSSSFWMLLASFALAIVTLIPSAGASLAIPVGMAAAGLAAYTAQAEWQAYTQQKTLANTDVDIAQSLITQEPSLSTFALALVELGLESLPLIGAFAKARRMKKLWELGEDTDDLRRELNALGKTKGRGTLGDEALAEVKATTKAGKATKPAAKVKGAKPAPAGDALHGVGLPRKPTPPVAYATSKEMAAGLGKALSEGKVLGGTKELNTMMADFLKSVTGKANATLDDLAKVAKTTKDPEARRLLEAMPKAYRAIRDPKHIEKVAAEVWEFAAKNNITTREALEAMVGGAVDMRKITSDAKFKDIIMQPESFRDLDFAADFHGAHTHMFQELLIDRALGKGSGRAFRQNLALADGPSVMINGNRKDFWAGAWDGMFDELVDETAHINRPEVLGKFLQEHLGLPRWAP